MSNWWTDENGNLIFEAQDGLSAMKLAGEGFAIANSKTGEAWNWRTFGDGTGFTADLITAGMIDAALVQIGHATTFAPGYDPSLIEGAASMGVDSDCVGLWHFDGSLNSHKGVAADSDGTFDTGCFGQALRIATGKHLKVTSPGAEGTVTFRAKNLAASANSSVLVDIPDSGNTEGLRVGIANNGNLYIEKVQATDPVDFSKTETTITDFAAGTLTQVWAKDGGLQLDTTTVRTWNDFTGASWEVLA
jgi:hypothetical protein